MGANLSICTLLIAQKVKFIAIKRNSSTRIA